MPGCLFIALLICLLDIMSMQNDSCINGNLSAQLFSEPGDYILGGLFPIYSSIIDMSTSVKPGQFKCQSLNWYGFIRALVMKFAVEEVNDMKDLLPGIRLGFEIFDTCMESVVIMQPSMLFLSEQWTQAIRVQCNYTSYQTRAIAIVGPSNSEMMAITGKLFSFFLIPQVSYGATCDIFSNKNLYPSFLRTVPSDKLQAMGMVKVVSHFKWNWIAVLGSEDEYGKQGLREFSNAASQASICIAYEGLIPVYTDPQSAINEILDRIKQMEVEVVVLFSTARTAQAFFTQVIRRGMKKVWVASSGWSIYQDVSLLPNIQTVGTVLGFIYKGVQLGRFELYVQKLYKQLKMEQKSSWSNDSSLLAEYFGVSGQVCPECVCSFNLSVLSQPLVKLTAFTVYAAVLSVAHALHRLLDCSATRCKGVEQQFYSWQLLKQLQNTSFQLNGTLFQFDANGNPNIGYEVITWVWGETPIFTKIGEFNGNLSIQSESIQWHTTNKKVPESQCSKDCQSGQVRRVKGFHSCCFDCIDCAAGTFQNQSDDFQCTACPQGQWSLMSSTNCSYPVYTHLDWSDCASVVLLLLTSALLVGTTIVTLLFIKYWRTALVQASGGPLNILMLLGLKASFCSLALFLGKPNDLVCRLQQPLTSFISTVMMSSLLASSLQVTCVTEFPGIAASYYSLVRGVASWLVVALALIVQAGICSWHILNSPLLSVWITNKYVHFLTAFLRCQVDPMTTFCLMLGFNGLLSLLSFMGTFMTQKPTKQYNMSRDITFAALAYCITWVIFIPVYTALSEMTKSLAQMVAIILSNTCIIASYFVPKCHLLLSRPDLNTSEYFHIYIEGVTPKSTEDESK
ncbi:taste receptor type 1 member 3 isoform X1 [Polypterus senegalus]|uniref:taste receptor type 1 member 3 isoform X1 n=2 Tax=Polypterus senegalus TaxID=55291 RepID=UPI0019653860|nr:taste receptor type 1 member 3 isoform X1 [Polypterus senegalus]